MCGICGCAEQEDVRVLGQHSHPDILPLEQNLLAANNEFAALNRAFFLKKNMKALNIMSSPGSGKTTLLAKTIADLKDKIPFAVIVGDQQTNYDAEKLQAAGTDAIQINTGKGCHLDAHSLGHALEELTFKEKSLLFIENIGNLVCPSLFDLGESKRIVLLSVTEGDNKPLKYPDMFCKADLLILTKIDLLPYVEFDSQGCVAYAQRINPSIQTLSLSAKTGEGLQAWYQWLFENQ